jgi:hypothetical protein
MFFNKTGLWDAGDYGSTPNFTSYRRGDNYPTKKDKIFLVSLAEQVADLSIRPIEKEKRELWYKLDALEAIRPLISCDIENGWNEVIPEKSLNCSSSLAKRWEFALLKEIWWGNKICDDKVIEPFFDIGYTYEESNWGLEQKFYGGLNGGSYTWEPLIKNKSDVHELRFPTLDIDYENTRQTVELAQSIFGGILKIRLRSVWWWSLGLTYELALFRGLGQMMIDMIDDPGFIHFLMCFIKEGVINKLKYLEEKNLLSLSNGCYVGPGGFAYTKELPSEGFKRRVRLKDIWGFSESQETIGISPEMFSEFIFPYQLEILRKFGLCSYGCCEPLEKRWKIIEQIPNLRRVSVSAFADIGKMAKYVEDKCIYSLKACPWDIATPEIDTKSIRKKLRNSFKLSEDCRVEVLMQDNHTIGNNPQNVIDWVRIAKEEAEKVKF